MHDLNKDSLIDGIEILKALTHDHGDESESSGNLLAISDFRRLSCQVQCT